MSGHLPNFRTSIEQVSLPPARIRLTPAPLVSSFERLTPIRSAWGNRRFCSCFLARVSASVLRTFSLASSVCGCPIRLQAYQHLFRHLVREPQHDTAPFVTARHHTPAG